MAIMPVATLLADHSPAVLSSLRSLACTPPTLFLSDLPAIIWVASVASARRRKSP